MTLEEFKASLAYDAPPEDISRPLKALWIDSNGDWEQAHRSIQDDDSPDAAWVHAYLHRKEGDHSNAEYWYRRARQQPSEKSLDDEWRDIASALLEQ